MGSGKRHSFTANRSVHWKRVARKHGYKSEICQSGLSKEKAYLLEMWLIAKYLHQGFSLCNMTDGGDGCNHGRAKPVYCSNGTRFRSITDAVRFIRSSGIASANTSMISTAAKNKGWTAYGYAWSFEEVPEKPLLTGKDSQAMQTSLKNSKAIESDLYGAFIGAAEAARFMTEKRGIKTHHTGIARAARERKTAYGSRWFYTI